MGGGGESEKESKKEGEGVKYREEYIKKRKSSSSFSLTCATVVQAARGLLFGTHGTPLGTVGAARNRRGLWENLWNHFHGPTN